MKILFDENMPYASELFSRLGDAQSIPGRLISRDTLGDANALMVRSVTKINPEVLSFSSIDFVGTATAGTDHIDEDWIRQQGIGFSAAPGCNAISVVEYVFSALLVLAERNGFQLYDKSIGIVGVGNVGSCLDARLKSLGVRTLLCDPPRAAQGNAEKEFLSLEKLVAEADVLTFHTPLNRLDPYPSWHLVNKDVLTALPDNRIIISACRGSVIDNAELLQALKKGKKLNIVLDVWEPEPDLSLQLLAQVDIGTPHIAGYTFEGKVRGTTQVFEAYSSYIGQPQQVALSTLLPIAEFSCIQFNGVLDQDKLKCLIHLVYDVRRDDALLRNVRGKVGGFDHIRKYYKMRREWSSLCVKCDNSASAELLLDLGFSVMM